MLPASSKHHVSLTYTYTSHTDELRIRAVLPASSKHHVFLMYSYTVHTGELQQFLWQGEAGVVVPA